MTLYLNLNEHSYDIIVERGALGRAGALLRLDRRVLVVTDEGFAKRTAISEYRLQGRNGFGVKAVQLTDERGSLVGALVVDEGDQVMAKSGTMPLVGTVVTIDEGSGRVLVRFSAVQQDWYESDELRHFEIGGSPEDP